MATPLDSTASFQPSLELTELEGDSAERVIVPARTKPSSNTPKIPRSIRQHTRFRRDALLQFHGSTRQSHQVQSARCDPGETDNSILHMQHGNAECGEAALWPRISPGPLR